MNRKTLAQIRNYLKKLNKMEENNELLPSPFEIEIYIDEVTRRMYKNGELIKNKKKLEELNELEEQLYELYKGAYEQ